MAMQCATLTFAFLLLGVAARDSVESPIKKVLKLVTEMKETTIKEGDQDLEAFDKYKCWCETTETEKTAAVKAAETSLQELTSFVDEAAAKEGQLKTEIASLTEDIAADKDSLASATTTRAEENAAFKKEEADLKETVESLAGSIKALSKLPSVLLQKPQKGQVVDAQALVQVRHIVRHVSSKFGSDMQKDLFDLLGEFEGADQPQRKASAFLGERLLPWEKSEEQEGMDAKANDLSGASAGVKSYNTQSGGIGGILNEQGIKFTDKLKEAQKSEMQSLIDFQSLSAAKTSEISAATTQKENKDLELGDLMDKAAKAKEDIEATQATLTADQNFLAEMTKNCASEDEDYAKRSKTRNEEITALSETLAILTGDDARDLFSKTYSFLQVDTASHVAAAQEAARSKAVQKIMMVAKKHKNWMLATLVVHAKLDAFTKVKEAMDTMAAELRVQQKEEVEKLDTCKKDIDATENKIWTANDEKEDLAETSKDQSNTLKVLHNGLDQLKSEIGEAEASLKQAGQQRKDQHKLFQSSVADQRGTAKILNMALERMKEFYAPNGASLVQARVHMQAPQPMAPAKPAGYKKSSGGGGVLQLLATIIQDAERAEAELQASEENAQQEYDEFVATTRASIDADHQATVNKEKQVAATQGEKAETAGAQLANDASLEKLNALLSGVHAECDYLIKHFDVRQQARSEEMGAIEEAKQILSGANFS